MQLFTNPMFPYNLLLMNSDGIFFFLSLAYVTSCTKFLASIFGEYFLDEKNQGYFRSLQNNRIRYLVKDLIEIFSDMPVGGK